VELRPLYLDLVSVKYGLNDPALFDAKYVKVAM